MLPLIRLLLLCHLFDGTEAFVELLEMKPQLKQSSVHRTGEVSGTQPPHVLCRGYFHHPNYTLHIKQRPRLLIRAGWQLGLLITPVPSHGMEGGRKEIVAQRAAVPAAFLRFPRAPLSTSRSCCLFCSHFLGQLLLRMVLLRWLLIHISGAWAGAQADGLLEGLELPIASDCGRFRKETAWLVSDVSRAITLLALAEVAPRRSPPDDFPCWPNIWYGIKRSTSAPQRSCLCPTVFLAV